MKYVRLGKTELIVSKPAMGCLPVQRCGEDDAVKLLRAAYERLLGNDELLDALYAYPGAGGNAKGTVLLHAEIYIFDGLARQLVEHLAAVGEFKGSHSRMYFLISG